MARNNWPLTPYSCKTFQSLSRGTRSYAFSKSTEHANRSLPYSQDFSKICFRVKIYLVRGAATRTKTALIIFQFWFDYFSAFPFKAFGIYFPWQTKERYPSVVCTLLAISFLEYGIITPVCQSLGVLPSFHATWHTRVNHRIPSPASAFNISGLISS